jgi:CheY-like chemotaxis protein
VSVSRIRVLLVDDNRDFLDGLVAWFEGDAQVAIVGAAETGMEGLDLVDRLRPDLVLLDIRMAPMGGFEAARCIKADPAAPVVVLTSFLGNEEMRRAAAAAGADRFLAKSDVVEGLAALAREMTGGRDPAPPVAAGSPGGDLGVRPARVRRKE